MRAPIIMFPRRSDVIWFLVATVLIVVLAIASAYPHFSGPDAMASRLGPDWDCQQMPKGGPICMKRPPKPAGD